MSVAARVGCVGDLLQTGGPGDPTAVIVCGKARNLHSALTFAYLPCSSR